jgi:hypothetical protein
MDCNGKAGVQKNRAFAAKLTSPDPFSSSARVVRAADVHPAQLAIDLVAPGILRRQGAVVEDRPHVHVRIADPCPQVRVPAVVGELRCGRAPDPGRYVLLDQIAEAVVPVIDGRCP